MKHVLLVAYVYVMIAHVMCIVTKYKYIVTVDIACGRYYENTTVLTARTDMTDAHPYAVCRGDHHFNYTAVDRATYTLNVTTEGNESKRCVFVKHSFIETYHVVTYVPISGKFFVKEESPYITTCNYATSGQGSSDENTFKESWKPLEDVLHNMGPLSNSSVDLHVVDVMQQPISGTIKLGKTIGLVANLINNNPLEVSFQTVSCKAKGVQSSYPIIIGGCGDGIVISKDDGFTTVGRNATSPFFKSFRLPGSTKLKFQCDFVVCFVNCDGSSCGHAKRKKRSAKNTRLGQI